MKKVLSLVLSLAIIMTMFIGIIPTASAASGLYVSGTKLYDGNGNELILRGANVPYAWFTSLSIRAINSLEALEQIVYVLYVQMVYNGQKQHTTNFQTLSRLVRITI